MTQITTALLDHMGSADHSYASILPCVRTLVMLTDHDYGFYYLKRYVCTLYWSSRYNAIYKVIIGTAYKTNEGCGIDYGCNLNHSVKCMLQGR